MVAEEFPFLVGNELAEGGGAGSVGGVGRFGEVERALEEEGWVGEGDGVGPGDALGGVGCGGGLEFNLFMVVDNAVFAGRAAVPEWPPAAVVLGKCAVGGGGGEKVAVVGTGFL